MDNSGFVEDCEKEFAVVKNDKLQNEKPAETPFTYTFEEAIALTETGRFHYQLLLTAGLCFLSVMCQILAVSIILPSIKCDLPATVQEQGLLGSAGFFGVVCSSHLMGFLGDTWGRVHTLKWALILSTIVGIISAFSVNVWMLIITRFLAGFFASGCQACVFSFCSEFHSNKTRARHVTLISVFLSMSMLYLPIEAVIVLPLKIDITFFGMLMSPWRFYLLGVNISPIFAFILLCFTPETPKYELVHGNHEKALNTMRKIFAINTKRPIEEYPVQNIKLEQSGSNIADIHNIKDFVKMVWTQTIPVFYKERILHTLNICLILFTTYGISHGLLVWYPSILNDEVNRDGDALCQVISEVDVLESENSNACLGQVETLTLWILTFVGVVLCVVYLLFAFTVNIVGKRNILIFWLIVCGLCCISVNWVTSLAGAVIVLTVICSVCNCGGIVGTLAVEFFPTNINAMAICFIMMIGRLGAVAGGNIFGLFIFDHCEGNFWALGIILFVMAFMSWLLPEKKRQKSLPTNGKP